MVQLHVNGGEPGNKEHWWKIRSEVLPMPQSRVGRQARGIRRHLDVRNISFRRTATVKEMSRVRIRADQGLTSYYGVLIAELRRYCKQRGLKNFQGKMKHELVRMLEQADDQAEFPRFLELPPEVRLLIYELSFDMVWSDPRARDYRIHALSIDSRPITSVCKLLREETLSLFYSRAILVVLIHCGIHSQTESGEKTDKVLHIFRLHGDMARAPPLILGLIKKIKFTIWIQDFTKGAGESSTINRWGITLPTADHKCQIIDLTPADQGAFADLTPANQGAYWMDASRKKALTEALCKMFDAQASLNAGQRLKIGRSTIEDVLRVCELTLAN